MVAYRSEDGFFTFTYLVLIFHNNDGGQVVKGIDGRLLIVTQPHKPQGLSPEMC